MSLNELRLAVNLFGRPVLLVAAALYAEKFTETLNNQAYLAPLSSLIQWGVLGLWLIAGALFFYGGWRLWCSFKGIGENCHSCGMPTTLIDPGRYSPHYRCLSCGSNRRAYF